MYYEFKCFLRDLSRQRQQLPDSIIVVVDANCQGYNGRKDVMDGALAPYLQFQQLVSYAIPDPHIERWMLVDPKAFQAVFGRGCTPPNNQMRQGRVQQEAAEKRDSGERD
jgi:hypothetical protein